MRVQGIVVVAFLTATAVAATGFQVLAGGSAADRGVFVTPTSDGGYVAVGVTASSGAGGEDVFLVKTDAGGKVLWTRAHGGTGTDNGWAVAESADGLVIAGFTTSSGAGGFDCSLLRTSREGELLWSKTYGGGADDRCWALATASDGGYLLLGETKSFGEGEEDCFLIKTDGSGIQEWTRTYGGSKGDRCFSLAADDDGLLLAGQTYSEGAGDRDAYLVKTDATGAAEWSRTYGGEASDVAHSVVRTSDGDYLVTGYTTSLAETGADDPYLIRVDAAGETRWTRVLPIAGLSRTLTGDQRADGGFVLTGFSVDRAKGTNHALLVAADRDGRLEWTRELFLNSAGQSLGYTVRATLDGGSVLTGHTSEGSAGDLDLFLVKVGADGR